MWQIKDKANQLAMFKRLGQQVTRHYIISQFPRIPETWEKQDMTGLIQHFALQQFSTSALLLAFQNSNPNFHFPYLPHQYIFIFQNQAPSKVKCHRTVLLQGSDSDRKAC